MFLKPPFDSVPNLILPVGLKRPLGLYSRLYVPSRKLPISKPLTAQLVIVTSSVARAKPSPKELFRQIPSSNGEFTLVFETCTWRQASTSIPSRFVSIFRLSTVKLSTPVARIAKCPPSRIEMSRKITFRQSFRLIALLPQPGSTASRGLG